MAGKAKSYLFEIVIIYEDFCYFMDFQALCEAYLKVVERLWPMEWSIPALALLIEDNLRNPVYPFSNFHLKKHLIITQQC